MAKRGDLAIIEREKSYHSTTKRETSVEYAVMLVVSITRGGDVKAVKDLRWGDGDDVWAQPTRLIHGLQRIHIVAKAEIDVAAALATARAHTWPGHDQPRDYDSIDAVREALRPHLLAKAAS